MLGLYAPGHRNVDTPNIVRDGTPGHRAFLGFGFALLVGDATFCRRAPREDATDKSEIRNPKSLLTVP